MELSKMCNLYNLTDKELEILKLFIKYEQKEIFESDIKQQDSDYSIQKSLIRKGFLNAIIRQGAQKYEHEEMIVWNWKINSHLVSDLTIELFDLKNKYPNVF